MGFDLLGLEWPLLPVWHGIFADAAKVRFPPVVSKGRVRFGLHAAIRAWYSERPFDEDFLMRASAQLLFFA